MEKEKVYKTKFKKIKNIIIIVFLTYSVINLIYSMIIMRTTPKDTTITLVTNEHLFVRISECLSKYITAINTKDPNDIINIYSDKYKMENNITIDNVLSINDLSNIVSFKIEKLYNDNTYYYAYVTFYSQDENLNIEKSSCELTIQFYRNNTFAITPKIQENLIQGD